MAGNSIVSFSPGCYQHRLCYLMGGRMTTGLFAFMFQRNGQFGIMPYKFSDPRFLLLKQAFA